MTITRTRHRVVAALAAGAAGTLAAVAAATSGSASTMSEVVVFDQRTELVENFVDLGDEGFTNGDIVLEHSGLVDPDSGAPVGRSVTRVNVFDAREAPSDDNPLGDFLFYLDCTVELEGGNLTFQGPGENAALPDGVTFSVTGGTGAYAGAGGTATVQLAEIDGQSGVTLTFDLSS